MDTFKELAELNVNEHVEKKGKFSYLSWAWAHDYLAKLDPDFDWWLHDFPAAADGQIKWPYMATPAGCFVRVTVKFKGRERTHTYPVLNHQNKPIQAEDLNAFDVNTSQMRAFAKCCALHGLGLYIFSGEDLPTAPDIKEQPAANVVMLGGKFEGMTLGEIATRGGIQGLGHLKWMSTNSSVGEVMRAKALEVWEAHKPDYTDDDVTDLIADADCVEELTGLYRCLTSEQQVTFKEMLGERRAELETDRPQRTAENARG